MISNSKPPPCDCRGLEAGRPGPQRQAFAPFPLSSGEPWAARGRRTGAQECHKGVHPPRKGPPMGYPYLLRSTPGPAHGPSFNLIRLRESYLAGGEVLGMAGGLAIFVLFRPNESYFWGCVDREDG